MNSFIPLDINGMIKQMDASDTSSPGIVLPDGIVSTIEEHTFLDGTVNRVHTFTFYCNSMAKTGDIMLPEVIRTGNGTQAMPFVDLNYALECLCCEAQKVCSTCFAFVLKVSGTVNYRVLPCDGNGVVFIDALEADITVNPGSAVGTPPANSIFYRLSNITLSANSINAILSSSGDFTPNPGTLNNGNYHGVFYDCSNIRVNFVTITDKYGSGVFNVCDHSYFCGSAIQVDVRTLVPVAPQDDSERNNVVVVDGNRYCYFSIDTTHINCVYPGEVNGFHDNLYCAFNNCECTASLSDIGEVFYGIHGCGFNDNHLVSDDNSITWMGENVGYNYSYGYPDYPDWAFVTPDYFIQQATFNDDCYQVTYEPSGSGFPSSEGSISQSSLSEDSPPPPSSNIPPPPPSSIIPPPPTGIVKCHHFERKLQFRLYALPYKYHDTDCKADVYVTSIHVSKGSLCGASGNPYTTEFTSYHGKLITLDGELDEWEDENGEIVRDCNVWTDVYCDPEGFFISDETDTRLTDVTDDAITSGTRDITALVNGELYVMPEHDDAPIAEDNNWKGFNQYQRCGSMGYMYPKTLTDTDRTLTVNTITGADYFSYGGEYPCMDGDGYGNVTIDTYVFEWQSSDDSDEQPKSLVLEDSSGNTIHCKFGQEYCLQGNEDVDRDMLSLVTCDDLVDPVCKYVVLKGTTSKYDVTQAGITLSNAGSSNYPKPTRTVSRTYTYKGVIF